MKLDEARHYTRGLLNLHIHYNMYTLHRTGYSEMF